MDLEVKDKVALVVASSSGLGKAVAKELAIEGAHVMLASRSADKLEKAKLEIEQVAKGKVAYYTFDQSDEDSIQDLVKHTQETLGSIAILFNNSGGPKPGKFENLNEDTDWQEAYELTLLSYVRLIQACLPDLIENKGRILNNTSSSIKEPIDGLTLSNVFRMGILGLSKTLSQELGEYGILVNTIGPGRIQTDRIDQLDQNQAEASGKSIEEIKQASIDKTALQRLGEPWEFAKAATFLLSYANTYVTGQTILVEGGMVKAI